jgi:hypothetical protein
MTAFEGLRAFPWIPDPVKDRSGMTKWEPGNDINNAWVETLLK